MFNFKEIKMNARNAISDKNFTKAEKLCRDTLAVEDNEQVGTILARALRLQGRLDEAAAEYQGVITRHGRNGFNLTGLAAVYKDMGRLAEAEKLCQEALDGRQRNIPALRTLGMVYSKMGNKAKAKECFAMIDGMGGGKGDGKRKAEPLAKAA